MDSSWLSRWARCCSLSASAACTFIRITGRHSCRRTRDSDATVGAACCARHPLHSSLILALTQSPPSHRTLAIRSAMFPSASSDHSERSACSTLRYRSYSPGSCPIKMLDSASPLTVALRGAGPSLAWLLPIVDLAAVIGLGSVVLVVMLAQPRVLMAMGDDGLVPPAFARVHPRYRTPHWGTVVCGLLVAILAGLFPLSILVQLVSVGTLMVFIAVALAVMVLRSNEPDRPRPFRTPFVPVVPIAGILVCVYILTGVPLRTWMVYLLWLALGISLYLAYGARSAARRRA